MRCISHPSVDNILEKDCAVKYVYTAVFLVIVTLMTLFAFQNSEVVKLSLLFTKVTLPVSLLIVLVYFLGMLTGGIFLT
ncbi:lipopolysaccharide assembly protein LapA domain-containing protein [Yersinia ruckeri]|nr:LapA family protein [Yersinia ruckeri]AKA39155.1 hypothetical protein UGYR_12645 [Yersinia ruckeri]AUQ41036.1 DUF1049 domain-containing protein [Yersinia ruckeri]EKN3347558.1 LapA family protein [Yersinia ruckeri]EKN3361322.1 LapA family protein [Yersinia ruckeri]EKN4183153.1 LapA family protein [Yersinia ruckeri]